MGDLSLESLHQSLDTVLSDVDRAVLDRDFAEFIAASFGRAMLHGLDGWYDDDVAELGDWGSTSPDRDARGALARGPGSVRAVRARRVAGRASRACAPTCSPMTGT